MNSERIRHRIDFSTELKNAAAAAERTMETLESLAEVVV